MNFHPIIRIIIIKELAAKAVEGKMRKIRVKILSSLAAKALKGR